MSIVLPGLTVGLIDGAGSTTRRAVRAATTINGTLSTAFANGQTIDGIVLTTGNRILIKNQTTTIDNGIYMVNASGAPTRAEDFDTEDTVAGAEVRVLEGSTQADTSWLCTNNIGADLVGSNAILFEQVGNIVAPASSSTNAIAKFNGTNGKLLANSGVIISATDGVSGIGTLTTSSTATFGGNTSVTGTLSSTGQLSGGNIVTTGTLAAGATTITGAASVSTNLTVTGNIITPGTVDGVDVSNLKVNFDGIALAKGDILVYNGSAIQRVPAGTNGQFLSASSLVASGIKWINASSSDSGLVSTVIADRKTLGTSGGTFTAGAPRIRDINFLADTEGGTTTAPSNGGIGISVTNKQIIIPGGTYFTIILATAYRVDKNRSWLQVVGAPQVSKIVCNADVAGSLASDYFYIVASSLLADSYQLWIQVNGSAAPAAQGGRTLLATANLALNASANTVAIAVYNALNSTGKFLVSIEENIVIVRTIIVGARTATTDGLVPTGFTFSTLQTGNSTTSVIDFSLSTFAKNSAQGTAVAATIITDIITNYTIICEIRHQCETTEVSDGFGIATGLSVGTPATTFEQYTSAFFHRVKRSQLEQ